MDVLFQTAEDASSCAKPYYDVILELRGSAHEGCSCAGRRDEARGRGPLSHTWRLRRGSGFARFRDEARSSGEASRPSQDATSAGRPKKRTETDCCLLLVVWLLLFLVVVVVVLVVVVVGVGVGVNTGWPRFE